MNSYIKTIIKHYIPYADDIPRLVQGDSGRVVQIFANLISNSIKFTTCRSNFLILVYSSLNKSGQSQKNINFKS